VVWAGTQTSDQAVVQVECLVVNQAQVETQMFAQEVQAGTQETYLEILYKSEHTIFDRCNRRQKQKSITQN
jgi:hypothetical protein